MIKQDDLIQRGFDELEKEAARLQSMRRVRSDVTDWGGRPIYEIPSPVFRGWGTRILNFLKRIYGEPNSHFQEFERIYTVSSGEYSEFEICRAIFLAAKKDYEGGYLFNARSLITADIFSDVIAQAKDLLDAGYKDAACIMTGVALETTLKALAARNGIPIGKLDKMNADLYKAGIYNMGKQKQITAWAELRNRSAHGEWDEYTADDVKDFNEGVARFMADFL